VKELTAYESIHQQLGRNRPDKKSPGTVPGARATTDRAPTMVTSLKSHSGYPSAQIFCTGLQVAVQSAGCLCLYFYSAGFLRSNSFQNVRKILLLF